MSKKEIKREREELRANRRVQTYFIKLEESKTFNGDDLKVLKESYNSLRQKVNPSDYSEVAMALTTALLTRTGRGITSKKLIKSASREPLIASAIRNENVLSLYGLNDEDLLIAALREDVEEENFEEEDQNSKHYVKEISFDKE